MLAVEQEDTELTGERRVGGASGGFQLKQICSGLHAEERRAITTLGPESYLAVAQVSSGGQVRSVKTRGPARILVSEEESELCLYPELDLVHLKALVWVLPWLQSTCCHWLHVLTLQPLISGCRGLASICL